MAVPGSDLPSSMIAVDGGKYENGYLGNGDVDHFHLFDDSNGPTKLIANEITPPQCINISPSEKALTSKDALWIPPLKDDPLASYYKLHRVPSSASMAEPTTPDSMEGVKLPRRESTTEPLEQILQNGIHNKVLDHVVRTPGRQPSPQPTHLSVPGPGPHRILHEEGSGYVAPKFEGKELQMEQGIRHHSSSASIPGTILICEYHSDGPA